MPSSTNWAAIEAWSRPGQEERRVAAHPGVADHQVLDRGPLGVAEVERAGDVRRRLDDRERRQRRVGGRAGAVGGEDVRREPALVDRALDIVRRIGLRQSPSGRIRRAPRETRSPLVQRTNGSWYHLLVRRPGRAAHRGPAWSGALSTRYRASPVTARERPSRRRARAARTIPRSLRGRPVATLLGPRREGGSVARAAAAARPRSRVGASRASSVG